MVEEPQKRPTLRTISELSGLAVPTVSRALNDAPDIGVKTKARVREIARQIGYVPNRAGLRLRTGKTNVISLVLGTDNEVTDHSGQLVSSIARALRDTRYHMIVTPYFPREDPMIPVRYIVETGSADAVILNRIEREDVRVRYLESRGFPFVTYGRTADATRQPYFDVDNESFGLQAAHSLLESGCRNIALLAPPQEQHYAQHMISGVRLGLAGTPVRFEVINGLTADDSGEQIRHFMERYVARNDALDGLICPSATTAIAAIVGCERAGRRLGQDIEVFAKESVPFLKFFRPELRTVAENVQEAGRFLARAAIQAIEAPDKPPLQKLVEPG